MPRRSWWLAALVVCGGCLDPHPGVATSGSTTTAGSTTDHASSGGSDTTSSTGSASSDDDSSAGSAAQTASTGHTDTSAATTTGEDPLCGDGHLDPGEECDNGLAGNADDAACLVDCKLATCGDGHVRKNLEECDDADEDPTNGCHQCFRSRKVFVTSDTYQGDQFMGLVGADQRCRSLAAQADLLNFATYKAWLSDSTTSPALRMVHGRGRYELVNGLLVAENWDDLILLGPKIPIDVDQHSQTHETGVWTGTNPDGSAAEGSDHCADWTSQAFGHTAFWGVSTEITADWTLADAPNNPSDCGAPLAIYCFEQE